MEVMLSDNDVKRNISVNVRRLLESRGWSQTQLADAAGETKMIISRICRGTHLPLSGVIVRIAEAFDVSVDRLVAEPPVENKRVSA